MYSRLALSAPVLALLLALTSPLRAPAQSDADRKTIEKARALYLTGPIPSSISCDVALDWDAVFKRISSQQTDESKARVQKLKAMQIQFVSHDADHTDVDIKDLDPSITSAGNGLRQQLSGILQIYWSMGHAQFLARRGEAFGLTTNDDGGYEETSNGGGGKAIVEINKDLVVTQFKFDSPQMNAVIKPTFKPGTDGLLRLDTAEETVALGATRMVVDFGWDYQKVDSFDIPHHVHTELPGSFAFDFTFSNCKAGATAAPDHPPAK